MLRKLSVLVLALAFSAAVLAGQSININTASAEEIADALHGVGLAKAEAIVAYRESNGPFSDADELVNVPGIGVRTVDQNRDRLALGSRD